MGILRRLAGAGLVASLFAMGYVLFTDGSSGLYEIGGNEEFVLSGGEVLLGGVILAALCFGFLRWSADRANNRQYKSPPPS